MRINPQARIVECGSAEGGVLVALMPHDLDHLLGALSRAGGR